MEGCTDRDKSDGQADYSWDRNSGDPAAAASHAGMIVTQVLGFALCRFVLPPPPVVALSRTEAVA